MPEERALAVQIEYVRWVDALIAEMASLAETAKQNAILDEEIERFKTKYAKMLYAVLDAQARTVSSMITGPANFPVRRNQKRMETEAKRQAEFLDWRTNARFAIRRKIIAARDTDKSDAPK